MSADLPSHPAPAHTDRPSRDSPSLTSIGFLLHLAMTRLREEVAAAIEGSGLHPGLLAILGALADCGPMSQKRLGEITRIEKSTMVLFVDALEAGDWIRRERDPTDRRAHRVTLTPEGEARYRALGPRLRQTQDRFLAPLSEAEHAALVDLLTRLGTG